MRIHTNIRGQGLLYLLQIVFYLFGHLQRIHIGLFGDGKDNGRLPIAGCHTHRHCCPYLHLSHISHGDGLRGTILDKRRCQLLQVAGAPHTSQSIFIAIFAQNPSRAVLTHSCHGGLQFGHGHTIGLHSRHIGLHLILLHITSYDGHLCHTSRGQHSGLYHPVGQGAQVHHAGGVTCLHAYKEYFTHDAALGSHDGSDAFGKFFAYGHHLLAYRLTGTIYICPPVKLNPHERVSCHGRRTHPAYISGPIDGSLYGEGDHSLGLLCCHALGVGHENHGGSCKVGKHIDIHLLCREITSQHHEYSSQEHHQAIMERIAYDTVDNVHALVLNESR